MDLNFLRQFWASLPPRVAGLVSHAASLLAGLLLALLFHYLLYRFSLPGTPFIYVVF